MPQNRCVVLVSDRLERAERLARGIAVLMSCRTVPFGGSLPATAPLAWIVDIDLEQAAVTRWFDDLCERIGTGTPCLCLARDANRRIDAAMGRLGAPIVVPARSHASGIIATLKNAIEHAARVDETPVARKLAKATGLVGNLFTAAALGAPPDPVEADAGTQIVLDAISDLGIRAWLDLVWRHDITVYQHSLSVAGYAAAFAAELGFSRGDRHRLAKAALLHDVGKARIPHAILDKPGPLTPEETETMRTHAAIGAGLLAASGRFEQEVLDVARSHHERLDGSGYPDGLKGNEIGDVVRLVAICDVHSALTERRIYRPPLSAEKARAILESMAGQLDPDLLQAYRPVLACAAGVS